MKVLNLLAAGNLGGIETLCNSIDKYSKIENEWVFLFDGGAIADEMKRRNPDKVHILKYYKYNIRGILKYIKKICKNNKIDIVVLQHDGILSNLVYILLKRAIPKTKFIKMLHHCYEKEYSLTNNFLRNKLILYGIKKSLQISDLIIGVSNAVKKSYIEKFQLDENKVDVVYNGIDMGFYKKQKVKENDRAQNIIYIGRIEKVKGLDVLIESLKNISKEYHLKTQIIGEGSYKHSLMNKVKEFDLEQYIHFIGGKESSEIISYLDNADVFVYPSICQEAFGISIVEAMARGCIPIAFNKGGIPEILVDGFNGKIINDTTPEALEKGIVDIIEYTKYKKLIKNALETSENFSIERTIDNLRREYFKVLNNHYENKSQL